MANNERFQSSYEAAQRYEQNIVQPIIKSHTNVVFDHVSLREGEQVLDVACGTGIVARVAAERFDNVGKFVGLDKNTAMLDVARENEPGNIKHGGKAICALYHFLTTVSMSCCVNKVCNTFQTSWQLSET